MPQGLYDSSYERGACGIGVVASIKGESSRKIVADALTVLKNLDHRGAICENSGDGAGIMISVPHFFYEHILKQEKQSFTLPPKGEYATGICFILNPEMVHPLKSLFITISKQFDISVLGWRVVPTINKDLSTSVLATEPQMFQVFLNKPKHLSEQQYEVNLYLIRKMVAKKLCENDSEGSSASLYICSLSSTTIVYKGQLTCAQLPQYFPDLNHELVTSHFALVHSRFSTNTFPSWERAHPNRYLCHNGEINTIKGNLFWMKAREEKLQHDLFGKNMCEIFPVVDFGGSDSASLDNVVELLRLSGRSLSQCMTMVMPEAWENDTTMEQATKKYYEHCAAIMEPWDGPALVTFCDGKTLGAVLDRNGLRPCRYYITNDDTLVLGSEVGPLPMDPQCIKSRGRVRPGQLFLVDFEQQRIISDREIKQHIVSEFPYGKWVDQYKLEVPKTPLDVSISTGLIENIMEDPRLKIFGFSVEHIEMLLKPLCIHGVEPLGSMGNDSALAVMSTQPRLLYSYFKQLFAQVTNPAIDSIRESIVMSLYSYIGPKGNLLKIEPTHCQRLFLQHPFLSLMECESIRNIHEWYPSWKTKTLEMTFPITSPLQHGIIALCKSAEAAAREGYQFIILSDRSVSETHAPIGSLLSCGAVHHHLVKQKLRSQVGIIIDTGDARKAHHFCTLLGYGADAVCPYLAIEIIFHLQSKGEFKLTPREVLSNYFVGLQRGTKKVMAKMGISTLQSYKGSQIFEALGLSSEVIDMCFVGTPSRVQGIGFKEIGKHILWRHQTAFDEHTKVKYRGDYHWRSGGAAHAYTPQSITTVQLAARTNSKQQYAEYAAESNLMTEQCMLRGMLRFRYVQNPLSLDDVEPASAIVKRFVTGAMSYGSLSIETHETLAIAMNRIGAQSNSGEGGEDPERFKTLPNGDSKRSAVKQIATGRFGVTSNYLANADQLQIKISQGAKPGEGGELGGAKVSKGIAKTRRTTPGVGLISPPPHHDIYSIEDLKQLIYDLKNANPEATVSVKLASEVGIGVIAAGVVKAGADHIVISGHEGGTGAARWTSIKHAGLPWELGIAETHQTLVLNNLRQFIRLQTDGCLRTGKDVVYAALLGAEEFGFGTIPLVTLGCIMMRKCHLNTCPVGIATQDPQLRKKFEGKPEHLINFFFMLAEEVRGYMAHMGFRAMDEMIGRVDLLYPRETRDNDEFPIEQYDFSALLTPAFDLRPNVPTKFTMRQPSELGSVLDQIFIKAAKDVIEGKEKTVEITARVTNIDRSVGTLLSYHVSRTHGENGLADNSINITLKGSAGQSFGAFVTSGVTLVLQGDSNDYVGKGLSGGTIVVRPLEGSPSGAVENVIVGNTVLYGATSGLALFAGSAAERFAVRNSGVCTVVEGVGDHCCEYMTGGRVVVLGQTGRNFAAGMSGGIAWVWNPESNFAAKVNTQMVFLERLSHEEELKEPLALIELHWTHTQSAKAKEILALPKSELLQKFIRIIPKDYKPIWIKENVKVKEPIVEEIADIEDLPVGKLAKIHAFKKYPRQAEPYRPIEERLSDWEEIWTSHSSDERVKQAARCMDCGVPFCQSESGCPIHNKIPEWNDLVYKHQWKLAYERLCETNNFPEFTGRVCPAPCEGACVLAITDQAVTIKNIENAIINKAFDNGWVVPRIPTSRSGKKVAVIGSGPAGLAAADQLNQLGHFVTVYERDPEIGGLLRYGVPQVKLSKKVVQRRVDLLAKEGIEFISNYNVDTQRYHSMRTEYQAILLAVGATKPRDMDLPGRGSTGVHFAMDYLKSSQQYLDGQCDNLMIDARGKNVIVIGAGDTGCDCISTAVRQGCKSILNFNLSYQPPDKRDSMANPWPQWPKVFTVEYGHQEATQHTGNEPRKYNVLTKGFVFDKETNKVTGIRTSTVSWKQREGTVGRSGMNMSEIEESETIYPADLILIAIGYTGVENHFDVNMNGDCLDAPLHQTSVSGVFAAGDCKRGQSLIVWAIREGRDAADQIHAYLSQKQIK